MNNNNNNNSDNDERIHLRIHSTNLSVACQAIENLKFNLNSKLYSNVESSVVNIRTILTYLLPTYMDMSFMRQMINNNSDNNNNIRIVLLLLIYMEDVYLSSIYTFICVYISLSQCKIRA